MPKEAFILPGRIRRHRVTTACSRCRERRIKCDRLKPACSPCTKYDIPCKYTSGKGRKIEFEHATANGPGPIPQLGDSWNLVLDNQADLSRVSPHTDTTTPSWVVAEKEESSLPLPNRCMPISLGTPLRSLEMKASSLTKRLPSCAICQTFFGNFIQTVHPFIPICDRSHLEQLYADFWATLGSDISAELYILVLSILYTGSFNGPCSDLQSSTLLKLYNEVASQMDMALYYIENQESGLQLLQAYLIMNTFQANQLAPFTAYGFLPQAIRFGQLQKLHVERSQAKSENETSISFSHIEERRKTWWHLMFLDVESVVANGLLPIIRSDGYTTQLPYMLRDRELPEDHRERFGRPESPMMVAMQGHYQWARHMQKWFEVLPTNVEVDEFKLLVEKLSNLITNNGSTESKWTRTYLKMQIDRAYCMLGLRFWQLDRFSGTGCHSEVVRTARSFLQNFLTLSSLSDPHFSWFIPGLIQPLHALIILLMHLSTCNDICAEEQLSRSLLDDVFEIRVSRIFNGSIWADKVRLKSGRRSNTRYGILVELRVKVWQRLGWDKDGKGKDPFGGRLDQEVEAEDCGYGKVDTATAEMENIVATESSQMDSFGESMDEDPLDMFQWDEWEGLTEGLFVS